MPPRKFLPLISLPLLLLGIPFLLVAPKIMAGEMRSEEGSVRTPGTVISRHIEESGSSGNAEVQYRLMFRFTDDRGIVTETGGYVSQERYDDAAPGSTIIVEYLPGAPAAARVYPRDTRLDGLVIGGVGGLCTLLWSWSLLHWLRGTLRLRRLRTGGILTEGTVSGVIPANMIINDIPQSRVVFSFQTSEGERVTGMSEPLPEHSAGLPKPGDRVRVRYLRGTPQVHALEPPLG